MNRIAAIDKFDEEDFRRHYVTWMQTPGSHNDTYASTCHRMFFANLMAGKAPGACADNDGHNVDTIDALTLAIPIVLKYCDASKDLRDKMVLDGIHVTRKTGKALDRYAVVFSDLLVNVINGKDLRTAIDEAGQDIGIQSVSALTRQARGDPMTACYIDSSFPATLFIASKYAESVEGAVLGNANAGGENVARGSCVGALLGAAHGTAAFPLWSRELYAKEAIMTGIDAFAK